MYWDNPAEAYGSGKKQSGPYFASPGGQYSFHEDSLAMNPVQAATEGIITRTAPRRNAALLERGNANVADIFSMPWGTPWGTPWAGSQKSPKARAIPQFSYSPSEPEAQAPFQYGELMTKDGKRLLYFEKTSLRQ